MSEEAELIPVKNTDKEGLIADVIFLHGINADPGKTWMVDNKPEGFPEQSWLYWIGEDIPNVAVWTLGYPAKASEWAGYSMTLPTRARMIINLLLVTHKVGIDRPVIFVVHSMGGLLVKYILELAKTEEDLKAESLIDTAKGIVFLSTPNKGSSIANMALTKSLNLLLPSKNLKELRKDAPELLRINEWFIDEFNSLNISIKVFGENELTIPKLLRPLGFIAKPFYSGITVVGEESASLSYTREDGSIASVPCGQVITLDRNHSSICWVRDKENRKQDQLYSNVFSFIQDFLNEQDNIMPIPPEDLITNLRKGLEGLTEIHLETFFQDTQAPKELISDSSAPQARRVNDYINWVISSEGIGLQSALDKLEEFISKK